MLSSKVFVYISNSVTGTLECFRRKWYTRGGYRINACSVVNKIGVKATVFYFLEGEVIQGLGSAVIRFWGGIFLVLFLFFPLFLGKMIGTGDIKVLAVLGSVLGPRKILFCIVTAFLLGAVESLFLLFFRCDWRQRFLYFFQYLQRAYVERSLPPYLVPGKRPENIHFTIPILGSVLLLYLGG